MSSPEEFFGSYGFAEEWTAAALTAEDTDIEAEFWREEELAIKGSFVEVRRQIDLVRRFTEGNDPNWQSFHTMPGQEAMTSIWVVNRVLPANQFVHVIKCRESSTTLDYEEYVVAQEGERCNSVRGQSTKEDDDELWDEDDLGDCALVEWCTGTNKVSIERGAGNKLLRPVQRYERPSRTRNNYAKCLDNATRIRRGLTNLSGLLALIESGVYYEPGVTGTLE